MDAAVAVRSSRRKPPDLLREVGVAARSTREKPREGAATATTRAGGGCRRNRSRWGRVSPLPLAGGGRHRSRWGKAPPRGRRMNLGLGIQQGNALSKSRAIITVRSNQAALSAPTPTWALACHMSHVYLTGYGVKKRYGPSF